MREFGVTAQSHLETLSSEQEGFSHLNPEGKEVWESLLSTTGTGIYIHGAVLVNARIDTALGAKFCIAVPQKQSLIA